MIRTGLVRAVENEHALSYSENHKIEVELDPLIGCGSCASAGGCGVQLLPSNDTRQVVKCANPGRLSLAPGEHVQVRLSDPDSSWLGLVAWAYGLPTVGIVLGTLLGHYLSQTLPISAVSDYLSLLGFVLGLGGGLFAWNQVAASILMKKRENTEHAQIVGLMLSNSK